MKTKLTLILAVFIPLVVLTARAQETVSGQLTVNGPVVAGTNSSTDDFEFRLDGTLIARGNFGTGSLLSSDFGGSSKMIWYPGKAAFVAGMLTGTESDVGQYSAAFGYNSKASGTYSFAAGTSSYATGQFSSALGVGCTSSGGGAFSVGFNNVASQSYCLAFGQFSTATGFCSFAGGSGSTAGGGGCFAYGSSAYSGGVDSLSVGTSTSTTGNQTTALGEHTNANAMDSVAVGRYNLAATGGSGPSLSSWVTTDPLFEIGNGADATHLADAVVVYKNGNMAVQGAVRFSPGGDLSMGSFTAGTHP